jgi:hypothetical protein
MAATWGLGVLESMLNSIYVGARVSAAVTS